MSDQEILDALAVVMEEEVAPAGLAWRSGTISGTWRGLH